MFLISKQKRWIGKLLLFVTVAGLVLSGLSGNAFGQLRLEGSNIHVFTNSDSTSVLSWQQPALPVGTVSKGGLSSSALLNLTIVLKPRHLNELANLAAAVSQPASPLYRHYLTPLEFANKFGLTPAALNSVKSWALSNGLKIGQISQDNLSIEISAQAESVSKALFTNFESLRLPSKRTAYMATAPPRIPSALSPYIQGIIGLENVVHPVPAVNFNKAYNSLPISRYSTPPQPFTAGPQSSGPQPCSAAQAYAQPNGTAWTAKQLAKAYSMNLMYTSGYLGSGTTIGLFELASYKSTDISRYESCYGVYPNITNISIDGGSGAPNSTSGEPTLDIEDIIGLAPEANIEVYEGPLSNTGVYDTISAMVNQDTAQVLSASWGLCEAFIGSTSAGEIETLAEQAALQGQTVLVSAGDSGSEDCYNSQYTPNATQLAVDLPASLPYVTGVGGTDLTSLGPPPKEVVWNSNHGSGYAGGGGISSLYQMPSWQKGPGVINSFSSATPCNAPSGSYCREVPDVSASASPTNGYIIYYTGSGTGSTGWQNVGGTSGSAPTWASVIALVDQNCSAVGTGYVGFINPDLYYFATLSPSPFNDITGGNNYLIGPSHGDYPATSGYDMASGLGSPIANVLANYLCAAPTVTSISPTSGPQAGGTTVTLTGTNFDTSSGATTVLFGSVSATGVSCTSTTSCTAVSPAGTGTVSVTVTTSGGISSSQSYTYIPAPTLTSISPTSGPASGGTTVTLTGTNFDTSSGGTTVLFGSVSATGVSCTSTTSCTAVSPAGTGTVSVTVTTSGGTSSSQSYTYIPAPTLTSISPTSGPASGGTTVTLTGTNFDTIPGATTVLFGSVSATGVSCTSTTSCTAVSPAGTGTVSVTVTTSGGISSSQSYTYIPAPTLTSISPTSGPASGGTTVTLTGTNFDTSSGGTTVLFGSVSATGVSCTSTTSCTAVSPAGTGTVSVTVTTSGGTSSGVNYTYTTTSSNTPTLTAISPISGPVAGGTTVTLTGTNFDTTPGGTTVDFGSVASTTVICTATTLCTAVSPSGPSGGGPVNVTVTTSGGTSNAVSFTYQLGATVSSAYVPLSSPTRICDTRPVSVLQLDYPSGYGWDSQCGAKTLGVGTTLTITAAGYVGDGGSSDVVPTSATAVVVNVTVADHTTGGYITVYPAGASMPTTSSLNFTPPTSTSGPLANLLQVTLGTGSSAGEISIYNRWGSTDVAVDVMGYFIPVTSGQGSFVPLSSPTRICDTRSASLLSKLYPSGYGWDTQCATKTLTGHTASDTLTISAAGYVGNAGSSDVVPTGATAVVLNVTEASNTLGGYLTVFPASSTMAKTSNLNFTPVSGAVPNGVIVGLSSSGKLSIFDLKGSVNVTVDVIGYYISATSSDEYHGLYSPTRICDTRSTSLLSTLYPSGYGWDTQCEGKTLSPNSTLTISAVGYVGDGGSNEVVPQGATAVVLNVTEATHTTGGYLTVYPAGTTRPTTSNLNFISTSGSVPNFVTVGLPTTGSNAGNISIYNLWGDTNITVDVVGYYG